MVKIFQTIGAMCFSLFALFPVLAICLVTAVLVWAIDFLNALGRIWRD